MQRILINVIAALLCLPAGAAALTLDGHLVQGGMAIGRVDPAVGVRFAGRQVRVSPDGMFVIGFSRDAKLNQTIELHPPSGSVEMNLRR